MILLITFGLDPMTIQADTESILVKLLRADFAYCVSSYS
jgi:hypothetical protein